MKKINCILLIDDNYVDNALRKINIKRVDICNHIAIATDGREALEYIIKSGEPNQSEKFPTPDLIYLDINMPRMNGFEFLTEYHKLDERLKSKTVIIMLSTSSYPDDKTKVIGFKEVSEFQNKPLTNAMLRKTVEKYF